MGRFTVGRMLRTRVVLDGFPVVTADLDRADIDRAGERVRVYLGESLTLDMPPETAEQLADALLDTLARSAVW